MKKQFILINDIGWGWGMKQIIVAGTGYVGLATGVSFATIGFKVTCVDIDENKINLLQKGICPIYEPGLQEALLENIMQERIDFTTNIDEAYRKADVIFIAVGTPELPNGTANLRYLKEVAKDIAIRASKDLVVVIKSTVPVGTNEVVKQILKDFAHPQLKLDVVSNPEFLREGSALHDIFHGDRIVIGADHPQSASFVADLYKSFNLPTFVTSVRSAEMIKYASNAFLATKISFINEIASICEVVGADVEQVAHGMGLDRRIGSQFLNAGIGFGGSCFPKDTSALIQSSALEGLELKLLKSVIDINEYQQLKLYELAKLYFGSLKDKQIAILGASFKPNTNDIRHAPSIALIKEFLKDGANITVYDPIALPEINREFGDLVKYSNDLYEAISNKDAALIVTEWNEIVRAELSQFETRMRHPLIFDGRNCFDVEEVQNTNLQYYSIGRKPVNVNLQVAQKL